MKLRKLISSYVCAIASSMLLALVPVSAFAQTQNKKYVAEQPDSVAFFRGVAVSVDLVGLIQQATGSYGQYEAALRLNLRDRYFPTIEVGLGKADAESVVTKVAYKTSAPYARVGIDFNMMKNKHDDYRIYAGLRYALTYYKYDAHTSGVTDPVWGDAADYSLEGVKCNYHWAEALVGVDAKIWGPLRLGWSLRYRRRLIHNDGNAGNTWYVPGYGKQGSSRLGGTFNVTFEI